MLQPDPNPRAELRAASSASRRRGFGRAKLSLPRVDFAVRSCRAGMLPPAAARRSVPFNLLLCGSAPRQAVSRMGIIGMARTAGKRRATSFCFMVCTPSAPGAGGKAKATQRVQAATTGPTPSIARSSNKCFSPTRIRAPSSVPHPRHRAGAVSVGLSCR